MATKKKTLKKPATGTATAQPTAPANDQAPAQAQPDPTALSIGDLKNLATILDVASSRGAFKAAEMAGVGLMYNKLQAFLAKVAPEQKPGEAPATDSTGGK
jgi:hypothetical protein